MLNGKICGYCYNARLEPECTDLSDDNDFSSACIGESSKGFRFMLSSGCGRPVRIELEYWSDSLHMWLTVGHYYPKFCPECGRKLDEYESRRFNCI